MINMVDYKVEGQRLLKFLRNKGYLKKKWDFRNGRNARANFYDILNWAKKKGYIDNWEMRT